MPASYEFNGAENATIASTARFAKIWGVISLISGLLILGLGLVAVFVVGAATAATTTSSASPLFKPAMIVAIGASLIPSALVSIVGGVFYLNSGSALSRVVDTQGNDIALLMDGVRSLSRAS